MTESMGHHAPPAATGRRHDLDALRVLAILAVFFFHCGRFFDFEGWHIKNSTTYLGAQVALLLFVVWLMPLIFLISGASTFYALASRGPGRFVKDRALRLLVPLAVGIFTHALYQVYLERVWHGQFQGSFFEFLPHAFEGFYGFGGNFPWMGMHLWYLQVLFVYSLLFLPLFVWLGRGGGADLARGIGRALSKPGAVYALAVPICVLVSAMDPRSPYGRRDTGGWSLLVYPLFFCYGFLVVASPELELQVKRQRWASFAAAILFLAVLGWLRASWDPPFGTPRFVLMQSLLGLSSWCCLLAILGFGMGHFTRGTPLLAHANEAVLPFYALHQSVILALGYFVIGSQLPDGLKYAIIVVGSFTIIAALYEGIVRRFTIARILFGMRPLRGPRARSQPP